MPGFTTDYAKSNRATCKGCQKLIAKDTLRIGKLVKSPHFDGEMTLWHHTACLFKKESIPDVALIEGFTNLRPDDQAKIKAKVNGGGGTSAPSISSASSAADTANVSIIPPIVDGDQFVTEYAKSSRSTCKHCGEKIQQDDLRIGKMVQSERFDGLVPQWYHRECAFKSVVIYSPAMISKMELLRPEDQASLKAEIIKHSPASATAAAAGDGDVEMEDAEKGKGKGKGKAKGKGKKKRSRDDDSDDDDESAESKPKKAAKSEATDFSKLTVAELKSRLEEAGLATTGKKVVLVERLQQHEASQTPTSSSSSAAVAPVDPVKAAHEKALEAESKARWRIRDAISDLSTGEMKSILAENKQPHSGGRDKLLDALVDGLMYGALTACPECKHVAFEYKEGEYCCTAFSSEWGRCVYKALDVKRTPFKVDDVYDGDNEYLLNYKYTKRKKPLEAYQYMASLTKAASESARQAQARAEEAIRLKQQELLRAQVSAELFEDFAFCFVGSKFPEVGQSLKALKQLVEEGGAEVVNSVDDADIVITTEEEVKNGKTKKIKTALEQKTPVLKASFILDSIEKVELQDPKDYAIDTSAVSDSTDAAAAAGAPTATNDSWSNLKKKVESGRAKSGAKLNGNDKSSKNGVSGNNKSMGTKSGKVTVKVKGRGAVDEDSGLEDVAHVLEEGKEVWMATLNITDITSGVNSYYVLQLLESDTKGEYWVFRKWGRVGTTIGSNKLTSFGRAKEAAKEDFCTVYLDKTGNDWQDRDQFQKKPGKFYPIDVDYSADDDLLDQADTESDVQSKLDPRVQDIIKIFFNVEQIKKTLLSMEIDLEKMPLGKLSRSHIQSGYNVLTSIQDVIRQPAPSASQLLALSNQFYTIIPHDFGQERPPILQTEEQIKSKIEMVETLLEIETATKMLKNGKEKAEGGEAESVIDKHYKQLHTDIQPLEHDSEDFGLIQKYVKNTHAPTHKNYTLDVLEAFSLDRENEADRYKAFEQTPNRMLLWHGSRTTNYCGILSQGLRIAPPEAPVTGYMFGKGVYFADMVSKSANYCFTSTANNIGFLLLCEVALGGMNELKNADYNASNLPAGKLSTKGIGLTIPDPKDFVTLPNGTVVPCGKPKKLAETSSLLYNEFIVYDVAQIRMKYLLKVRFNYQQRW